MTLDMLAAVDDRLNTPERELAVITLLDCGEIGQRQGEDGGHAAVTPTLFTMTGSTVLFESLRPSARTHSYRAHAGHDNVIIASTIVTMQSCLGKTRQVHGACQAIKVAHMIRTKQVDKTALSPFQQFAGLAGQLHPDLTQRLCKTEIGTEPPPTLALFETALGDFIMDF
jgi:hypothetical protein